MSGNKYYLSCFCGYDGLREFYAGVSHGVLGSSWGFKSSEASAQLDTQETFLSWQGAGTDGLGPQLGLLMLLPTHGLTMWLVLLTVGLGSKTEHPRGPGRSC